MATRADEPLITGYAETERLRVDIVETRNHMAKTVDAIEERLSPKNLKAQVSSVKEHVLEELADAKDRIKTDVTSEIAETKQRVRQATVGRVEDMIHDARDTFIDAGSSTLDTVRTNPIPAALVAVGVGWLLVSGMRGGGKRRRFEDARIRATVRNDAGYSYGAGGYGYGERYGYEGYDDAYGPHEAEVAGEHGFVDDVREAPRRAIRRGRRIASDLGETASGIGHDVAERAAFEGRRAATLARDARMKGSRAVRRAGMQARRYEQSFERGVRDNPLAFGAVAVAVGAAIGLLLPHTEVEDRYVGEKKDMLFDQAKERAEGIAQQAMSTVEEKASTLAGAAGTVADRIGEASQTSGQNGTSMRPNGVSKH